MKYLFFVTLFFLGFTSSVFAGGEEVPVVNWNETLQVSNDYYVESGPVGPGAKVAVSDFQIWSGSGNPVFVDYIKVKTNATINEIGSVQLYSVDAQDGKIYIADGSISNGEILFSAFSLGQYSDFIIDASIASTAKDGATIRFDIVDISAYDTVTGKKVTPYSLPVQMDEMVVRSHIAQPIISIEVENATSRSSKTGVYFSIGVKNALNVSRAFYSIVGEAYKAKVGNGWLGYGEAWQYCPIYSNTPTGKYAVVANVLCNGNIVQGTSGGFQVVPPLDIARNPDAVCIGETIQLYGQSFNTEGYMSVEIFSEADNASWYGNVRVNAGNPDNSVFCQFQMPGILYAYNEKGGASEEVKIQPGDYTITLYGHAGFDRAKLTVLKPEVTISGLKGKIFTTGDFLDVTLTGNVQNANLEVKLLSKDTNDTRGFFTMLWGGYGKGTYNETIASSYFPCPGRYEIIYRDTLSGTQASTGVFTVNAEPVAIVMIPPTVAPASDKATITIEILDGKLHQTVVNPINDLVEIKTSSKTGFAVGTRSKLKKQK